MYDPERSWNLSFTACGFLSTYCIGVHHCINERAPHLCSNARRVFGGSAGSLLAASLLGGLPAETSLKIFSAFSRCAMSHKTGVFHPSFNISRIIREQLHRYLPANIHQLTSGRMFVSLTRVSDWRNVLVSEFRSKDEVVDALVCSCFIPILSGLIPPSFRGVRYIDGGLTNATPVFDAETTITVSPFYGEYDICPKVKSTHFFHIEVARFSIQLCSENFRLLSRLLFPTNIKEIGELCLQGYLDAARFLEENGICNRPQPCLSSSSQEPGVPVLPCETTDLGASPGLATWSVSPERKELLDLHHGPLPWDKRLLDKTSPRLILALINTFKEDNTFMSKIHNFLPVKVMSYVMLPCTLPVEYAIITVQRLVKWLPYAPDDIQWLQSITSPICSRVIRHLLPTYSSQMLASSQQPSLPNQSVTDTSGRPTPRGPGCPPLGLTSAGQN
ncbi:1-acylglycerol-3-phosphate O-acyltransferase PNPLA3 isoform X1 [Pteropus medius]|uniref:1-acylglycerol-3-phosphate O-acyltransferase PNPLA3 isoform X1 n=2 Tax=Pteropus vampyrus TaxID=132908 RepID=UPI00196A8EC8|nr:1-acylglycerol-3-phosphate O-acyltransferase PNPLA3 isoform X1 [Pteropus giganteus]